MKRLVPWLAACALAFISATAAQAAVTLLIDANGELTGANGVDVAGTLYDVRFVDGTCAAVFSGCDDASDFAFATAAAAAPASQALLDQVLLDVAGGMFDSNPELTLGCDIVGGTCDVRTAVAQGTTPTNVVRSDALNGTGSDGVSSSCCAFDTSVNPLAVYAVWTLATPAQVSEPSSLLGAATALLALGVVRRRRA